MKYVAVIGASGFVGQEIANAIEKDERYRLIPVHRGDDIKELLRLADIIIHSANPAGRLNAENFPEKDFTETVEKTAYLLSLVQDKRFILISSLSCRTQLYGSYGRNRRACELMALPKNSLIIRLGPMFGGDKKKTMLHDILRSKEIFVSGDTKYAYVDVEWAGKQIIKMMEDGNGIKEIGAYNSVCLKDLRDFFESKSIFSGINETQEPENFTDGPDAYDVYRYAKKEIELL